MSYRQFSLKTLQSRIAGFLIIAVVFFLLLLIYNRLQQSRHALAFAGTLKTCSGIEEIDKVLDCTSNSYTKHHAGREIVIFVPFPTLNPFVPSGVVTIKYFLNNNGNVTAAKTTTAYRGL